MRTRLPSGAALLVISLGLTACDEARIRVYEVAREESREPGGAAEPVTVRLPSPPEGWEEKDTGSGPRVASFNVPDGENGSIDVSVTRFPGATGGLLANVNRWRGEAGQPAVEEATLGSVTESIEVGGRTVTLLNVSNEELRILGAILPLGSHTWFVKVTGSADGVAREEANFREYVLGFEFDAAPGPAPSPARPEIDYDRPDGWSDQETTSMRVASFIVEGEGGQTADISVIPLGGNAGGMLANVNNWRAALQLDPVTEAQLPAVLGEFTGGDNDFQFVDLVSEKPLIDETRIARMIVAFTKTGDHTWFFKIVGEAQVVAAEKEKFLEFVKTARIGQKG